MANVIVEDNISRILTADALNSGLKTGNTLNMAPAVASFIQNQLGQSNTQVQSVAYAELATLELPDFSVVVVSDVGISGVGSLWFNQSTNWYPVAGTVNISRFPYDEIAHTEYTAGVEYTYLEIPIPLGLAKPGVEITLNYAYNSSAVIEGHDFNHKLYIKNGTDEDAVFCINWDSERVENNLIKVVFRTEQDSQLLITEIDSTNAPATPITLIRDVNFANGEGFDGYPLDYSEPFSFIIKFTSWDDSNGFNFLGAVLKADFF